MSSSDQRGRVPRWSLIKTSCSIAAVLQPIVRSETTAKMMGDGRSPPSSLVAVTMQLLMMVAA